MDRGLQLGEDDEDDEDDEEDEEARRRTRRRTRRTRQEEEATDIKSNNPHLAGGEKRIYTFNRYLKHITCAPGFTMTCSFTNMKLQGQKPRCRRHCEQPIGNLGNFKFMLGKHHMGWGNPPN